MTTSQTIRVAALAFIAVGAPACASAPEPASPPARQAFEAEALLPAHVTNVERAACVASGLRAAAEGYANRRARARTAAMRRNVQASTLAETSERAAAQASVTALDMTQLAAADVSRMRQAMAVSMRSARLSAEALRLNNARTSAVRESGAGSGEPDVMTPDEAVQAATRAAAEVERSVGAASRYARLAAFHAEAFEVALAAERGEASAAAVESANAELVRAVAEWPDGEMLYRVNFANASAEPSSDCTP